MRQLEIGDRFTVEVVEHTDCRACCFYGFARFGVFCNKCVPLMVGDGGCWEHGTMFRIVDVKED